MTVFHGYMARLIENVVLHFASHVAVGARTVKFLVLLAAAFEWPTRLATTPDDRVAQNDFFYMLPAEPPRQHFCDETEFLRDEVMTCWLDRHRIGRSLAI